MIHDGKVNQSKQMRSELSQESFYVVKVSTCMILMSNSA